ncbi:unnamed protein product [Cercospora beticola]|nr:unnamed protein product [Cercospora beticola]
MSQHAEFDAFREHLKWALETVDGHNLHSYRHEAEQRWEQSITPEDRTRFAELAKQAEDALAYTLDADSILLNMEEDGDWEDGKWPNMLTWPVVALHDEQVNELQAYMRVQESYMFCLQTVSRIFSELTYGYVKYKLDHIFKRLWDDLATYNDYLELWNPRLQRLKDYCGSPEFVARMAPSSLKKTTSLFVEADEGKIWTQAINIAPNKGNKLSLWVAYNQAGRLVDRYVLKRDVEEPEKYNNKRHWIQNDDGIPVPNEFWLQNKCWEKDQGSFVRIRQCSWKPFVCEYKISYCPFGDLMDLQRQFEWSDPVPEPILWYIFEKLAQQCVAMEESYGDPNEKQIVHRDIKPENIFLDLPNPNYFPAYPEAKLADFGLAIETSQYDDTNPHTMQHTGTPPFLAPEQKINIKGRGPHGQVQPEKILSHTNVWAMGLVMLEFVNETPIGGQKQYVGGRASYYAPDRTARARYSPELLRLISQCLDFWPVGRIPARGLLARILADRQRVPNGVGAYCQAAANGQQVEGGLQEWRKGRERYKLMMAN